jgi:hypothetical protein
MDSGNEKMFTALLEEEANMKIISCLLAMYARDLKPWRRGSSLGQRKSKPRQRLEGYGMLYADYFSHDRCTTK